MLIIKFSRLKVENILISIVSVTVIFSITLILSNFIQIRQIELESENIDFHTTVIELEYSEPIKAELLERIYSKYDLNIFKPDTIYINDKKETVLFYTKKIIEKIPVDGEMDLNSVIVGKNISTSERELNFNDNSIRVTNIMAKDKGISYYDDAIYVPLSYYDQLKTSNFKIGADKVLVRYKDKIDEVEFNRFIDDLKNEHKVIINDIKEINEADNVRYTISKIGFDINIIYKMLFVSIITLIIVSVSCFSTRIVEMGLKRAIGIPDYIILGEIISEAIILSFVNNVVVLTLNIILGRYIFNIFNFKIYLSFQSFFTTFLVAALIYLISYIAVLYYTYSRGISSLLREEA